MKKMKHFRIWAGLLSMIMVINTVSLDLYAAGYVTDNNSEVLKENEETDSISEVTDEQGEEEDSANDDATEDSQPDEEDTKQDNTSEEGDLEDDSQDDENAVETEDSQDEESEDNLEETVVEDGEETEEIIGDEIIETEALDGAMGYVTVSNITDDDRIYTGEAITLDNMVVSFKGKELVKGVDYTITFKNNKNAYSYFYGEPEFNAAKAPSYTIKGIGNYSGSITEYFTIIPAVINSTTCVYANISVEENGKEQKPVPTITFINKNGKTIQLKNNVDFTCNYAGVGENSYIAAGVYGIEVNGINNFSSTIYVYVNIYESSSYCSVDKLTVKAVPVQNINLWKSGSVEPKLVVTDGKTVLTEDVDYTVSYDNNQAVGTAIATIAGKVELNTTTEKLYTGHKFVSFKITGTAMNARTISYSMPASKDYKGEPIVIDDEIIITDNQVADEDNKAKVLIKNKDYTLSYAANNKAGRATVTITGIGTYTGVVKKTFNILPYDLASDTEKIKVVLGGQTVYENGNQSAVPETGYVKGGAKPQLTVTFDGKELLEGTDYSVKYVNNTKVCTDAANAKCPYVVITGKNGFKGNLKTLKYLIDAQDISNCTIDVADRVYARKEGNYVVTPVITDADGKKLVAGTDYSKEFTYTYKNATKLPNGDQRAAGENVQEADVAPAGAVITLTVSGTGSYGGTISCDYMMVGADIAKASVKINTQYYTGEPVELDKSDIVITVAGRVIGDNEYEIVGYNNNINKGNAEVTIQGVGDVVGGCKTFKFVIANRPFDSTIVFNGNGALTGNMRNISVSTSKKFSAQIKNIAACTYKRPGYVFTGWNSEADGTGTSYPDKEAVYKIFGAPDIEYYPGNYGSYTIYAQWKPIQYTITYHLAGGTNNAKNTKLNFTADDSFDIYPVEKAQWPVGYQFGGWYKEDSYKTRVSRIMHGTIGDLNLYAKWVPYTYTVHFDANAPTGKTVKNTMSDEAFSYGVSKALLANKYVVDGYAFTGWSLSNTGDVIVTDKQSITENELGLVKESTVGKEVTLYAVWKNAFTVKFVSNGGVDVLDLSFGYGDKVVLPATTRAGYDFAGWYMDSECRVKAGTLATKNGQNYVLYAKWTPYKYTVAFDKNDRAALGTMAALSCSIDEAKALKINTFINRGYKFTGWNTKADKSGTTYADGAEVINLASAKGAKVVLYAMWEKTSYKITYNSNGGTLNKSSAGYFDIYNYGDKKDFPIPEKAGYVFKGWYSDVNCTKQVKSLTAATYGDMTLYAAWTSDKTGDMTGRKFNISVKNLEDGKLVGAVPNYYYYGTEMIVLPAGENAPERKGYTFGGWYRDAACKKAIKEINSKDNDDISLYIKWVAKKYKVSFNAGAPLGTTATGRMATKIFTFGKETAIGKNLYKIKGYSFLGWSMAPNSEYIVWADNQKITGSGDAIDISVYAQWEKDQYSITYVNMDGLENDNPTTYNVDSAFSLTNPQVMGNTFQGWYLDKNFKKKVTQIKKGTTGNLTIYAKWARNTYTILYDLNDNDGIIYKAKLLNGDRAGYGTDYEDYADNGYVLPSAERTGFTFGGWSRDKAGKNPVTALFDAPNVDTTVYAKWNPIRYKITYVLDGGTNSGNPATYIVSKNDIVLKNPTKCGYEFKGWFSNADFSGDRVTRIKAGTLGDITLYAKWQIIHYTIKFNNNGGTGTIKDVSLVGPEEFTMPSTGMTKTDYTLDGWNTKADGTGTSYKLGEKVKGIATYDNQVITLYAMWKNDIYSKLIAMKSKYPEGKSWTNNNVYTWKGGNSNEIPGKGAGCVAFAYILSDAAFGDAKASRHTNFNNIRPGDIVRLEGDQHTVIVLKVEDGIYTIAEGNYNGKVHWGRQLSQSDMNKAEYVITRY